MKIHCRGLSSPKFDIQNAMRGKNAFLMRLGFAGETNNEQAMDLLHSFREECIIRIQKMKEAKEVIARDEAFLSHDIMKYWKLVALHGEIMHNARLEWAEKAISILENEK